VLTKEARALQKTIKELVPECSVKDKKLLVQVLIYENWLNQDGTVKTKDVSNREKFLIDSVFKALGVDDKYIFCQTLIKVQSVDVEKSVITIEEF
jgi:hypothetical protein